MVARVADMFAKIISRRHVEAAQIPVLHRVARDVLKGVAADDVVVTLLG